MTDSAKHLKEATAAMLEVKTERQLGAWHEIWMNTLDYLHLSDELISGHAVATGTAGEVVPGLEGEFVAIRESSAKMGVARAASLITYTLAFCDTNGVELTETIKGGFLDLQERAA